MRSQGGVTLNAQLGLLCVHPGRNWHPPGKVPRAIGRADP